MKTHNVLISEELSPAKASAHGDGFVIRHVDGTVRSELLRELVGAHEASMSRWLRSSSVSRLFSVVKPPASEVGL